MPNNHNDSELEGRLLNNNLLFGTIRKNKIPEDKIKKIKKYLDRGADINAADANHKNNTPLHVAVIKEELEIVTFLLEQGARANIKNSDNQTALDIVRESDENNSKIKGIVTILQTYNNHEIKQSSSQQDNDTDLTRKCNSKSANKEQDPKNLGGIVAKKYSSIYNRGVERNISKSKPQKENIFQYNKRTGTSGNSGQLYETKLLSLILFRALHVHTVHSFLLATNVESIGAFDDIVFRFYSNKCDKPKILFVQAKHRDNPAKDKFTVEEIMKLNGDFSLHKYLESYIKISQMFAPENSDGMFRGEFKNTDCEFIIYTPAFENFTKMKSVEQTEGKPFINTSDGKVFQFNYDDHDVECLVQTIAKSRAVLLAKRLSKFIFKNNYSNMMMDEMIKTYHVFLAQNVLAVEVIDGDSQNDFRYAKFQSTLFTSNDSLLLAFKATICQEKKKNMSLDEQEEIVSILKSSSFKVPVDFGNLKFCFSGSEQKAEKKLKYLCSTFKKLFDNANVTMNNIVMKVDDNNMVGPNKILQSKDLEPYRIGGLVGNLLVFDNISKTLKFNSDVDTLSEDNLKLLERLKSEVFIEIDLSKCRFDINVHRFPRLSLIHDDYDKGLIKNFLGKLFFYTNQAKEGKVESILKEDIRMIFVRNIPRQSDAFFKVKCDAIFLKVHDQVQNWWKQPDQAPYLTESCQYFIEAEQDILNSPLLSILNFTYIETIKNALPDLKFKDTALELLHLDGFLKGTAKILYIVTKDNAFTSIKLIQYFNTRSFYDYSFIDLDYVVIGNYSLDVESEIKESKTNILIAVGHNTGLFSLTKYFKGKVIIICNQDIDHQIFNTPAENIVKTVDSQIDFNDLADTMCTILLEERYIVFQGEEVPLGILLENEYHHRINSIVLYKIIRNERITVGNFLNNPAYDEILDFYIYERVCRYVTLDYNVQAIGELNILKYNEVSDDFTPDKRDIILITDEAEEFAEFIYKYGNCNVHWFKCSGDKCLVWQKSRGSLLNILKHIHRGAHNAYTLQPVTLKDVKEKVVIISGEPGMGKSSLLTHLAINTKHKNPTLWISKINLLEITNELKRIKDGKKITRLKDAVRLLFRILGFEAYKESKADFEIIIKQVSVIGNRINFNKNGARNSKLSLLGLNLFEIELFINCYNNDRVVLLFDGFDEICPDFADEFLQLVKILKKSKVAHLWITSRLYNVLHQLENTLGTFSFTIQPLSSEDQDLFFEKIGLRKFGLKYDYLSNLKSYIETLIGEDRINEVLSIPLHLYFISVICYDFVYDYESKTRRKTNLNQLYKQFVDVKFSKIRFGEKKPGLSTNDPDMRKLIDKERKSFFHVHKIIGAYVIFGKMNEIELLDQHDINEIRDFFEGIKVGEEKTGLIEQIIQNEPKFVHYTFAEYFAVEFLCDKLKKFRGGASPWMYLTNSFLQSEEGGLQRFFNAKLENHPLMFNEVPKVDVTVTFSTLLLQYEKLAKLVYLAVSQEYEHTAIFLLKCIKAVVNKNNVTDFINVINVTVCNHCCVSCIAAYKSNYVLKFIIELIKEFDVNGLSVLLKCSDFCSPLLIAVFSPKDRFDSCTDVDVLEAFLSDLSPPVIVELFCMQVKDNTFNHVKYNGFMNHVVGLKRFKKCINEALEKLNSNQLMTVFSAKDSNQKLAAHTAASYQDFEFFFYLEFLLESSDYIQICMTHDASGLTPIHYFRYDNKTCKELEYLLGRVYGPDANAKLTINYFINKHRKLMMA